MTTFLAIGLGLSVSNVTLSIVAASLIEAHRLCIVCDRTSGRPS